MRFFPLLFIILVSSMHLYLFVCLFVRSSVWLFILLSMCLFIYMSVFVSLHSIYLFT